MTIAEYLAAHPIYHPTTLAAIKKGFYASGGPKLRRTEILVALGAAGYRVQESRLGFQVVPVKPAHAASTTAGWVGPHLQP